MLFALITGDTRHASILHGDLGKPFGTHQLNGVFIGADKDNACLFACLGKGGIFGEKAVTGMHRIGAGLLAGGEQGVHVQVGGAGQGRADADRFVSQLHMTGTGIRLGIDRHGPVAQGLGGGDDPAGNLATVGNQDFFKAHCDSLPVFRLKMLSRRSCA